MTSRIVGAFFLVLVACSGDVGAGADAGAASDAAPDARSDARALCTSSAACDDGLFCNGAETCAPATPDADARGCVPGTAHCRLAELCAESTRACVDCTSIDADSDGVSECDGDCDDADASRYSGAAETCDFLGHDEDCNDTTYGAKDDDADGHVDARCCNGMNCGFDCDDTRAGVHPGVPEVCNGIDDDCNALIDEGVLATFYRDADGDDYGLEEVTIAACLRPAGYTDTTTFDCDDANAGRNPGLAELCNDRDDDCDVATRPWDRDMDGYDDFECGGSDCDDASLAFHPGLPDPCDGIDNDCSTGRLGEDGDNDGHAALSDTCTAGALPRDDCDDRRALTYPGAPELCNAVDDDCDGTIDGVAAQATCASTLTCAGRCAGVLAVSLGQSHTCALTASGAILCWGDNTSYRLGDGTTVARSVPTLVVGVAAALEVSAGGTHSCARTATGVLCWGSNLSGQLGDATTIARASPVAVAGLGAVAQLATGHQHTCALTAAGVVWCWGSNLNGQLGDGTTVSRSTPVSVGFPPAVVIVELVAGGGPAGSHTCARSSAGTVFCWGRNAGGEVGDGTTSNRASPAAVVGLADATALAAGATNTCAVRTSGAVVCWGDNSSGQLGDGTLSLRSTSPATDVVGLTDATAVTLGNAHACAMSASRGLLCWGNNMFGQLGIGTTVSPVRSPTAVIGAIASAMRANGTHTCARRADDAVSCWGTNSDGRVGDGTTMTPRPSPTPVRGAS